MVELNDKVAINSPPVIDEATIDISVIHDTYIYSCRHSGEGRNPGNYKSPRSVATPPILAFPATRSYLASWIPAFAGMTGNESLPLQGEG